MEKYLKLRHAAFVVFFLIMFLMSFFIYTHWITFDADNINFYNISFSVLNSTNYADIAHRTVNAMTDVGFSKEITAIVMFRHDFQFNYPIYVLFFSINSYLDVFILNQMDYPGGIFSIFSFILSAIHFSVALLAVYQFARLKEDKQRYAAILALCFFSIMMLQLSPSFPVHISPGSYWRVAENGEIFQSLKNMLNFFLAPGKDGDIFGYTPRNSYTLLLVSVFLLRWRGDIPNSYLLLLAGCLLHMTYGVIGMALMIAADTVVRPRMLRHRKIVGALLLVSLLNILQSGHWSNIGGTSVAIAMIIGLFLAFALCTTRSFEAVTARIGLIATLRRNRLEYSDLYIFLLMAFCLCVISISISTVFSGNFAKYVVAELAGRPLALIRIPIVLGLCIVCVDLLRGYGKYLALSGGAAMVLLLIVTLIVAPHHVMAPTQAAIHEEFVAILAAAPEQERAGLSEMMIQYAISCEVAGRCDLVRRLEASARHHAAERERLDPPAGILGAPATPKAAR